MTERRRIIEVNARVYEDGVPKRIGRVIRHGAEVSEIKWEAWQHRSGRQHVQATSFVSNKSLRVC